MRQALIPLLLVSLIAITYHQLMSVAPLARRASHSTVPQRERVRRARLPSDLSAFIRKTKMRAYPAPAAIPNDIANQYAISSSVIRGSPVFTLVPKRLRDDNVIIYTHGGAYVEPLNPIHWRIIDSLSRATGATMVVPSYPLAPEANNRQTWPLLTEIYVRALKHTSATNITLAGDSAGGGLVLGQALELRDQRLPLPSRLILFSPWVDVTLRSKMRQIGPIDHDRRIQRLRLEGRWWAGPDPVTDPKISPLFANLTGLPPVDIYQGRRDIFLVTSRELAVRLRGAGVPTRLFEYPGAVHVYMGATSTPEARDTFRLVGAQIRARSHNRPESKIAHPSAKPTAAFSIRSGPATDIWMAPIIADVEPGEQFEMLRKLILPALAIAMVSVPAVASAQRYVDSSQGFRADDYDDADEAYSPTYDYDDESAPWAADDQKARVEDGWAGDWQQERWGYIDDEGDEDDNDD